MNNQQRTEYQIFISYRRDGSDAHARVFYEKLKEIGFSVFLDFESLFSGGFEQNIMDAIDCCEDFVLLLPKNGLERCQDEEDILRKEIGQAIKGGKNIIPIFIGGFVMPSKKDLPEDISLLAEEHGFYCSMEYFDAVFEKLLRNLKSQPNDRYLYETVSKVKDRILSVKHDYFKKWASLKLEKFMSDNYTFFSGTDYTNPHAENTFGVSGIEFTKRCLKATTAVSDYWNDSFTLSYLKKQADMIKNGIAITRIFIIDAGKVNEAIAQMRYQHNLGISVYYIEKGNKYINPDWLLEDYLIQDDELLVQIYCESHKFNSNDTNSEEITTDTFKVKQKIERFQRIKERSILFDEKNFDSKTVSP